MPFSIVNGAPPQQTEIADGRGRVTAPWFAYFVGLQRANSGVTVGLGGLDLAGQTVSGAGVFSGSIRFALAPIFTDQAGTRAALGLGSAATHAAADFDAAGAASAAQAAAIAASLQRASNLSDLANAATARTNLGLGSAALNNTADFDAAGAASAAQAAAIAASLQRASNLSDLANAATARTNLGLGSAALLASSAVAQVGLGNTFTQGQAFAPTSASVWAVNLTGASGPNAGLELTNTTAATGRQFAVYSSSGGAFAIDDNTAAANRLQISSAGAVTIPGSLTVGGNAVVPQIAANLASSGATGVSGTLPIANGGTGGTTAATARTNLGLGSAATQASTAFDAAGAAAALLASANTWAAAATFSAAVTFSAPASIAFGSGWLSWTPTITGSGSMTVSAVTVAFATYLQIGALCMVEAVISFTTGGTLAPSVLISLPLNYKGASALWFAAATFASTGVGSVINGVASLAANSPTLTLYAGADSVTNYSASAHSAFLRFAYRVG